MPRQGFAFRKFDRLQFPAVSFDHLAESIIAFLFAIPDDNDMNQLEGYDKWFAYYNTPVYFPYEFDIWQYSAKGTVDGIKGDVDMNIQMKKYGGE